MLEADNFLNLYRDERLEDGTLEVRQERLQVHNGGGQGKGLETTHGSYLKLARERILQKRIYLTL
jgi:hypothetical protein